MRIHRSLLEQFKHALVGTNRHTDGARFTARGAGANRSSDCKQHICVCGSLIVCCAGCLYILVCALDGCGEPANSAATSSGGAHLANSNSNRLGLDGTRIEMLLYAPAKCVENEQQQQKQLGECDAKGGGVVG